MTHRSERELGLEGQHSYVVLDMKQTDHERVLLLKNPWIDGKGWRGSTPLTNLSSDMVAATSVAKSATDSYQRDSTPSRERPHPATFWLPLEQIVQHFDSLYLSWSPALFRYRQDLHFEWDLSADHGPEGNLLNHPQFSLSTRGDGHIWLVLSRHFPNALEDRNNRGTSAASGSEAEAKASMSAAPQGYMGIIVCLCNGERVYIKETCVQSTPYVNAWECQLRWPCSANKHYTVVIDQERLPSRLQNFTLSAFSTPKVALDHATVRYPAHTEVEGQWTKESAGGNTLSQNYCSNPQYSLELKERTSLMMMMMSNDARLALHVKLVHGYGQRIYRLKNRDMLGDSGDHRGKCAKAEIADVPAGTYTVVCSLFDAGMTGAFKMRIDSTIPVALKPIPREGAGRIPMQLARACFVPSCQKLVAPVIPVRPVNVTFTAKFVHVSGQGSYGRCWARLSVEVDAGIGRAVRVASEQGQYSDALTMRTRSVRLHGGLLGKGKVWLVLERLSSPLDSIPVSYEVEMSADVPQACVVGLWGAE